jgi:hypothetical protein
MLKFRNVDIKKEVLCSTKNEDSGNHRYIEIIQAIGINEIIADLKAISYTYLRHLAYVKPFNRKGGKL